MKPLHGQGITYCSLISPWCRHGNHPARRGKSCQQHEWLVLHSFALVDAGRLWRAQRHKGGGCLTEAKSAWPPRCSEWLLRLESPGCCTEGTPFLSLRFSLLILIFFDAGIIWYYWLGGLSGLRNLRILVWSNVIPAGAGSFHELGGSWDDTIQRKSPKKTGKSAASFVAVLCSGMELSWTLDNLWLQIPSEELKSVEMLPYLATFIKYIIKYFLDEHSNWISLGFFWDFDWYGIGHMLRVEEMTGVGCTGSTLRGWQFQKAASWPSCRAETLVDATIWTWPISMDVPSKTDTDW